MDEICRTHYKVHMVNKHIFMGHLGGVVLDMAKLTKGEALAPNMHVRELLGPTWSYLHLGV